MATSSVGGRMQGISPLPTEGLEKYVMLFFPSAPHTTRTKGCSSQHYGVNVK